MLDFASGRTNKRRHTARSEGFRRPSRLNHRPNLEILETRQLLAASLAPIANVTVPAYLGYQVTLNGSGAGAPQTFTAKSNNPNVKVTVAGGHFVTLNITHTAASGHPNDISFAGPVTFQLFGAMTPNTAKEIEQFVTDGFYNGKVFHRVANGFPGPNDFIVQGGSLSGNGTGSSGQPGTPFPDEFNQQLAFTGPYQVAMANAGPDTNDTQFFVTTHSLQELDSAFTVFAQVVAGQNIIQDMTKVAVGLSQGTTPLSPIVIQNATVSTTNPNGVLHVDVTHANPGQTAVITVTANQGSTTVLRTFKVNVVPNTLVERPFVNQLPDLTAGLNQTVTFQIPAVKASPGVKFGYKVAGGVTVFPNVFTPVVNATVTVDQSTGIVRVVPKKNYTGPITLLYGVRAASLPDIPESYEYHTLKLTVNASATPVFQRPIAVGFSKTAAVGTPTFIQLVARNPNPGTNPTLTYTIFSQPLHGTITNFDASKGTLNYTPFKGYKGVDIFRYTVTASRPGKPPQTSVRTYVNLSV